MFKIAFYSRTQYRLVPSIEAVKLNFGFGLGKGVSVSFSRPTVFLLEDFESLKFLSLIGEDTNWLFPIGYSNSSI